MAENIDDIRRPLPAGAESADEEPESEEEVPAQAKNGRSKEKKEKREKKMTGPIFWMILTAAIVIDIVELLADLSVVFSIATMITGPVFSFVLLTYYFLIGVSLTDKKAVLKIANWTINGIISFIPFLNWLPQATINLIITRIIENSRLYQTASTAVSVKKAGRNLARGAIQEAKEEAVQEIKEEAV